MPTDIATTVWRVDTPVLFVLAGRAGTGKTTLGRSIAAHLRAALLRIDAIETAVQRCGLAESPVGPVGYVVAREIAAATLAVGTPVVIDAVNPVPEARAGWRALATTSGVRLVVVETALADEDEHRRRVSVRHPDLEGQRVPTWDEVRSAEYVEWDEARDGPRHVVDTADAVQAFAAVRALVGAGSAPEVRGPPG